MLENEALWDFLELFEEYDFVVRKPSGCFVRLFKTAISSGYVTVQPDYDGPHVDESGWVLRRAGSED